MDVLRIVVSGDMTSFRYPHFVQGVHLSYEMPPPATVYGHICSSIGDFIPADSLEFAYHFNHQGKFFDYEHLHFFGREAKMNPFKREMLFQPRLTLYIKILREEIIALLDLQTAFLSPTYPVVLGRSQDLMMYEEVALISVEQSQDAFFSGTLLSLEDAARIGGRFYAVTMPRYLNEARQPRWGQYAILPETERPPTTETMLQEHGSRFSTWVDGSISHPFETKFKRGLIWHGWI